MTGNADDQCRDFFLAARLDTRAGPQIVKSARRFASCPASYGVVKWNNRWSSSAPLQVDLEGGADVVDHRNGHRPRRVGRADARAATDRPELRLGGTRPDSRAGRAQPPLAG